MKSQILSTKINLMTKRDRKHSSGCGKTHNRLIEPTNDKNATWKSKT